MIKAKPPFLPLKTLPLTGTTKANKGSQWRWMKSLPARGRKASCQIIVLKHLFRVAAPVECVESDPIQLTVDTVWPAGGALRVLGRRCATGWPRLITPIRQYI